MKVILEAYKIPPGSWVSDSIGSWTWVEQCGNPMRILREIEITNGHGVKQTLRGGPFLVDPRNGRIEAVDSGKMLCWTPTDRELRKYLGCGDSGETE